MSLGRRLALLDWAREAGAWILEDDYDSEYRFSGRPLEALQGLDRAGRVLYIGTFSKVLLPALRLGYLVAPTELIESLLAMRRFIRARRKTPGFSHGDISRAPYLGQGRGLPPLVQPSSMPNE